MKHKCSWRKRNKSEESFDKRWVKGERVIHVNHRLNKLKARSRELLLSEKGLEHRSQRPADVEQTFGTLKWNKKFKRFLLRGIEKVEIEFGLLSIAHNLSKLAIKCQ